MSLFAAPRLPLPLGEDCRRCCRFFPHLRFPALHAGSTKSTAPAGFRRRKPPSIQSSVPRVLPTRAAAAKPIAHELCTIAIALGAKIPVGQVSADPSVAPVFHSPPIPSPRTKRAARPAWQWLVGQSRRPIRANRIGQNACHQRPACDNGGRAKNPNRKLRLILKPAECGRVAAFVLHAEESAHSNSARHQQRKAWRRDASSAAHPGPPPPAASAAAPA